MYTECSDFVTGLKTLQSMHAHHSCAWSAESTKSFWRNRWRRSTWMASWDTTLKWPGKNSKPRNLCEYTLTNEKSIDSFKHSMHKPRWRECYSLERLMEGSQREIFKQMAGGGEGYCIASKEDQASISEETVPWSILHQRWRLYHLVVHTYTQKMSLHRYRV